ncbi:TraB/GumN family protein [Paenibacillus sp. SYP-B4298]|uniref:TraB/GumN family protein n=1 Tax=Paenibacillus sp. SYP-B4298 TaxID=2996034 RepID=UPI0022DDB277|nr:TraB/GumN family protein [Paenibacillus sp. SYP-B4298]
MHKKKIIALFVSLFMLMSIFSTAQAAEKSISVMLNGKQLELGQAEPIVEKGTTLAPMQPLLEQLGATYSWDEKTKTASASKSELTMEFQLGSQEAQVNGKTLQLALAPKQVKGVTYVPVRFVGEALGYTVSWSQADRAVLLTSEMATQAEAGRGFLWKVENKGNTVYLLGSIHVAKKDMYPLRDEIENALIAADKLSVEIDLTRIDQNALAATTLALAQYNDGTTLKDHISADTYAKVQKFLKDNGAPTNALDGFKPWAVTQTISSSQIAAAGYQPEIGIDMYLMNKANEMKKPIISLESVDSQLNMFNNFSDPLQEKLLLQTLEAGEGEDSSQGIDMLTKMWAEGDEEVLLQLTQALGWDKEYYKGMLTDRNIAMTEQIIDYLNSDKKETHLVVVGSLHMLDKDGLVTLLEKAGFEVEKQ